MTQSPPEGMLPVTQDDIAATNAFFDSWPRTSVPGFFRSALAEHMRDHRLAAEARTRDAGWQPIETALQIELEYILASNGFWVEKVCFVPRTEGDGREGPGWVAHHGDVTPTHWMPLPKPSPRAALSEKITLSPNGYIKFMDAERDMTTPDRPNAEEVAPDIFALEMVVAAAKNAYERLLPFAKLEDYDRARLLTLAGAVRTAEGTFSAKTEAELIWPGNPRHTCGCCGGYIPGMMHMAPCAPMTEAEVMVELGYLPNEYFSHAKSCIVTPSNWPRLDAAILERGH